MVSVIIPVYNTEIYLEKCIQSVLEQTYKELEIIIINDGSTDSSGEICRKWQKIDQRIKYIEKENGGQGTARNLGIAMASGEYMIFVDSDDYLDQDLINKVYTCILKEKADICVYAHYGVGKELYETPLRFKVRHGCSVEKNGYLLSHMIPMLCNKMFSSNLIRTSDIKMDNHICEDLVFNAQLYVRARKICMVDIPLYYYRYKREGNMSTSYDRYLEIEESINELHEIFHRDNLFERYWRGLYQISFTMFKDVLFRIRKRTDLDVPLEIKNKYSMFFSVFKKCLTRWYSEYLNIGLLEKSYLLVGSYNLRVLVHGMLLDEDFLREDYGSSSIISLMSDSMGKIISLKQYEFKNSYRKRCVEQDINKSFYSRDLSDGIDYIVMDLLEEILDLIKLGDNCYITESPFLKETHIEALHSYSRIPFLSSQRRPLFIKYVKAFSEKVKQMGIPVIIVKNFLCEKHSEYYDIFTEYDNTEYIRAINHELEWCYGQLYEYLPESIIADSSEFRELLFTYNDFPFGCEPVYYNDGYYQRMAMKISECVHNRGI